MIRASIILAIAWCASRLMRNRPAAERHLLWAFALATASLLPVLTLIVPVWRPEVAARIVAALPALSRVNAVEHAQQAGGAIVHAVGIEPESSTELILLAVWIIGAIGALCRLLHGARTIRHLKSHSQLLSTPEWVQAGLKRQVCLLFCADSSLPLTWGVFRPLILLPGNANEWSEGRRFSVLAHELAHIRRCDWLFQILAEVMCALYWFNPLFWVARNQLHLESERACDDAVLTLGVDGKEYAQHLLDIARSLKRREPRWSLAMAGQIHLEKRLVAVLKSTANRRSMTWKAVAAVVLPILCFVAPIVALRTPIADPGPPRVILYTMPPLYSDEARREGVEGIVKIEAHVDSRGRAWGLRVIQGLGYGLDENALLAVRNWQFSPSNRADAIARVDVEFNLRNAELNDRIANDMATSVGPDVVPPRIVHRVEARFPITATPQQRRGSVLLDAVIQEDGRTKVLRVIRSLSWEMDEAAIAALEQWRFIPAQMVMPPEPDSRIASHPNPPRAIPFSDQFTVPVTVKVRMNVEMTFVPPAH